MTRFFEIAEGIAPLLDGSWRYNRIAEERCGQDWMSRAVLNDSDCPGRQIVLSGIWNKQGRVRIWGRIPHGHTGTEITVSERRDIPSIAKDINRRFLPGFVAEAEAAQASHEHRQAQMESYRHQVDILRRFLSEFRHPHSQTLTGSDEFYFRGGRVRLWVGDDDTDLRIRLPFDDLVRVLMFIYGDQICE